MTTTAVSSFTKIGATMKRRIRQLAHMLGCEEELKYLIMGLGEEPTTYLSCATHRVLHPKTIRHTLQITSFGGAGTTFLYEFAKSANLDIYSPYDGGECRFDFGVWKHLRTPITDDQSPRLHTKPDYRVVYLVSNPYNAVCSLFRRNATYWTPERLQVPSKLRNGYNRAWSIDEYLAQGFDFFQLSDHVLNWTQRPLSKKYPIMVLKYEHIADYKNELLKFMRVDSDKGHMFPTITKRSSDFKSLSAKSRANFEKMYGQLAAYIDALPDYFIR